MNAKAQPPLEVPPALGNEVVPRVLLGALGNTGKASARSPRHRSPPRGEGARRFSWAAFRASSTASRATSISDRPEPRERSSICFRYSSRVAKSMAGNAGAARSTSSTRLTLSKNSSQSMEDIHRMLLMMFRTVALAAPWAWCSWATTSLGDVPWALSFRLSQTRAGMIDASWSRSRWTSWTANARARGVSSRPRRTSSVFSAGRPLSPSRRSASSSALARAWREPTISSDNRRRFSTRAMRRWMATAQSSPMLSGWTRW